MGGRSCKALRDGVCERGKMKHYMKLNGEPFCMVATGKKDIELRLYDEKRRMIKPGDVICFSHRDNGEELFAAVLAMHAFEDFSGIYELFDKERLGYKSNEAANPSDMELYYSAEDIKKYGAVGIEICLLDRLTPALLVDRGICPTCFDKENGGVLYGDGEDKLIYKDDRVVCFLAGNPRAEGHAIISSVKHYKDTSELPSELCAYVFCLAQRLMCGIKETYGCESVYLCTMCDGPMNHFHLQLIPRYSFEKRGSTNFVKPRSEYLCNYQKLEKLRKILNSI